MPRMRARGVLVVLAAAVAAATLWSTPALGASAARGAGEAQADALTLALRTGQLTDAQYALYRALAIFDRDAVTARFGWVAPAGPRDGTPVLRDLLLALDDLSPAERAQARRLLARPFAARPDDPTSSGDLAYYDVAPPPADDYFYACWAYCVSWVGSGRDASSPAYVARVVTALDTVWNTEIGTLGFRAPKSDANSPDPYAIDDRLDVYLLDLTSKTGLYGYCTSDDPNIADPGYPGLEGSAYCVLDNDYAEFALPQDALEATAAHEFFHAVQFAYNFYQDRWLLEATATWMEDEVFDDVNDNYQYVRDSQVVAPFVPLDLFSPADDPDLGGFVYGAYTFFQLLTENVSGPVVRQMFEAGDGVPGKPGNHSLIAVPSALRANGVSFPDFYNFYAGANAFPPLFYSEGANWVAGDGSQLSAPLPKPLTLTARKPQTPLRSFKLDHLTYRYAAFRPGKGVKANAKLVVSVEVLPTGGRARLLVIGKNGSLREQPIRVAKGKGTATLKGFGGARYVLLVLSNGSTRVRACYSAEGYPTFACSGVPVDDQRRFAYQAALR